MYQFITNRVRFSLLLHWAFEMAAPVLPGGRGGSPAGGPVPLPPLPPTLPDPKGLAGPGPLPAGAALLAQMVTAMQAAAAGITSPRSRKSSTTPTWSENIPPYF